ncbi:hypothetical protein NA57DRAFT_60557 [Rhizodiscina lignyota]|uniref:MYND-type domain-containing protein n=1 Tax=Rhizodiscina lignyota TaxID=1504668 RepID=A0A9P4I3Y6_9PEZI|nr:hypothetical protein NA57DRAFT_60557 [Rhizodiscina lignyota]
MRSSSVPASVVDDINALDEADPICVYLRILDAAPDDVFIDSAKRTWPALELLLSFVANRDSSRCLSGIATARYIQDLAEKAQTHTGQVVDPQERFFQDLQDIALVYTEAYPDPEDKKRSWRVRIFSKMAMAARGFPGEGEDISNPGPPATHREARSCACCGAQPEKLLLCIGCRDTTVEGGPARYCNQRCQKEHWQKHRSICRQRQELIFLPRAASILRDLFYILRRRCFISSGVDTVEQHGILNVVLKERGKDTFPTRRFISNGSVLSEKEEAILSCSCYGESAFMAPIVDLVLGVGDSPTKSIREISGQVRNVKRPIAIIDDQNRKTNNAYIDHHVLKVSMKSGSIFAVDITGAQYGWPEPAVEWTQFKRSRLHFVRRDEQFGEIFRSVGDYHFELNMAYALKHCIQDWCDLNHMNFQGLVRQREEWFQERASDLHQFVSGAFDEKITDFENRGIWSLAMKDDRLVVMVERTLAEEVEVSDTEIAEDILAMGMDLDAEGRTDTRRNHHV